MNSIEEQFIQLTQDESNPEEILKLIGTSEDLYLECKTIGEENPPRRVTDKQSVAYMNLGKSISAFANAEGGIIIWGLVAREQGKDSPDLIQEAKPLENVTKVKTDFDSILGKVVSRRVVRVQNKVVYSDKKKDIGFIVTYVPKSDEAPHRVECERNEGRRYYRRHGNGSYPMEHYELEEMFGGRLSPKLIFVISVREGHAIREVKHYKLAFGLKNIGRVIAKFPFIEIQQSGSCSLERDQYGIDGNGSTGLPFVVGSRSKYQGGISHIIHADDILWIDQFKFKKDAVFEGQEQTCLIIAKYACDRFRMRNVNALFDLKNLINRPLEIIESSPEG